MNLGKWEMPFGKHEGAALEDVPASYLLWLIEQNECPQMIKNYVAMHEKTLQQEKREEYATYSERKKNQSKLY